MEFGLWKSQTVNIHRVNNLKILLNNEKIWVVYHLVGDDDNISVIRSNKVDQDDRLSLLEKTVNANDCHIQVHLSRKLHPRGDATSEPCKPTFHGGHLSRNTSYGGAATLRVFRLPQRRYSYSTQSSMTELLLSVSQHWNLRLG